MPVINKEILNPIAQEQIVDAIESIKSFLHDTEWIACDQAIEKVNKFFERMRKELVFTHRFCLYLVLSRDLNHDIRFPPRFAKEYADICEYYHTLSIDGLVKMLQDGNVHLLPNFQPS